MDSDAIIVDEIIQSYADGKIAESSIIAGLALVVYDGLLLLDDEVNLFWGRPLSGAQVLYLANKYVFLLSVIVNSVSFVTTFSDQSSSCGGVEGAAVVLSTFPYFVWAAFSALRAYALSRSPYLAVAVGTFSMVPVGVDLTHLGFNYVGSSDPIFGCGYFQDLPTQLPLTSSLIVADLLLIGITWYKLYGAVGWSLLFQRHSVTVTSILLCDGTIYFIVLLALNVLQMAFTLASIFQEAGAQISNVTALIEPVTAVLIARFLLRLQRANQKDLKLGVASSNGITTTDADGAAWRTITFAQVATSVGATLNPEDFWRDGSASEMDSVVEDGTSVTGGSAHGYEGERSGNATLLHDRRGFMDLEFRADRGVGFSVAVTATDIGVDTILLVSAYDGICVRGLKLH
ncbi:uncharacterized protein BXZ73DRAFT_76121 [Epithele typhae]|uniref:uncharacterized protein n=1 Tax=Epithele typhae TaxID=378194 RepID=UPI0020087596|nr:uncharacterized protein BXZ73DRAFT_76121 [Epithele typhae]KAH9938955.1 hypothetical protein BXZ73DRAFT_76121 [Epithele typhae]